LPFEVSPDLEDLDDEPERQEELRAMMSDDPSPHQDERLPWRETSEGI
jgi:hypothetical protein